LFAATEDASDIAAALIYHVRRHADTYWRLLPALEGAHPKLESSTIVSWIKGCGLPGRTSGPSAW
jgi:hypothetical protein